MLSNRVKREELVQCDTSKTVYLTRIDTVVLHLEIDAATAVSMVTATGEGRHPSGSTESNLDLRREYDKFMFVCLTVLNANNCTHFVLLY